jgi:hypothetical protein
MVDVYVATLLTGALLAFILYVVLTNNKYVASAIQMGEIGRREEVNAEIQEAKAAPVRVAAKTTTRERISFTIGMLNIWLTAYILGAFPTLFYLWHTPKAVVLIALRWWDFKKRKQHYLLYDFCYWANGLVLLYIWVLPHNETLFQIVFLSANGPLAWAVLAFNQSLALHKWQQVTSVFLHISPMLVTYGIRWYDSHGMFRVCADFPACTDVGIWESLWVALSRFYLWWIVLYYLWIFVFLGDYIKTRSFQTLYDRVAGQQAKFLFHHRWVAPIHDLAKKGIYMSMHVIFGAITMLLASTLLFHYKYAQMAFGILMTAMSCYNASAHYDAQFRTDSQVDLSKKN